jgi:hypothetical protein
VIIFVKGISYLGECGTDLGGIGNLLVCPGIVGLDDYCCIMGIAYPWSSAAGDKKRASCQEKKKENHTSSIHHH